MGRLDDMKRAAANKPPLPIARPAVLVPEKPPKPKEPDKSKPPPAPKIRQACGCEVSVRDFQNTLCSACRNKRKQEKNQSGTRQKDRAAWDANNRFPHGTKIELDPYLDHENGGPLWKGRAAVPGFGEFAAEASGVEWVLRRLWKCYRDERRRREEPEAQSQPG